MEEDREQLEKIYQQLNTEENIILKNAINHLFLRKIIIIYSCFWFDSFKINTDILKNGFSSFSSPYCFL